MGYCAVIKNITKNMWVSEENNGKIKHTIYENKALVFYNEEDAVPTLEYLNGYFPDFYTLIEVKRIEKN
jgi:predicted ribosome-associated RNA-binding protein Tma20